MHANVRAGPHLDVPPLDNIPTPGLCRCWTGSRTRCLPRSTRRCGWSRAARPPPTCTSPAASTARPSRASTVRTRGRAQGSCEKCVGVGGGGGGGGGAVWSCSASSHSCIPCCAGNWSDYACTCTCIGEFNKQQPGEEGRGCVRRIETGRDPLSATLFPPPPPPRPRSFSQATASTPPRAPALWSRRGTPSTPSSPALVGGWGGGGGGRGGQERLFRYP